MRICTLLGALILVLATNVRAAEGMWTLDNLPLAQLQSRYQFVPDDAWIQKVMHAALRSSQGCSASFVSSTGLVLTNHHCIRRCIEELSSGHRNLMSNGFLAHSKSAELQCPGLEFDQLEDTTDVTADIKVAVKDKQGEEFNRAYSAAAAEKNEDCMQRSTDVAQRCDIVALYHGGKYIVYRFHRYLDVRLVWAPEYSTAFFGGDLDNFNFPRYNLDAAILRVYEDNKPAVIKDYFEINQAGPSQNELLFVIGNPASTQRELTMSQLLTSRDMRLPRLVVLYSEYRGVLEQYQKSAKTALNTSTNELYSVENKLKALRGQLEILNNESLMSQKREEEAKLKRFVADNAKYNNAVQAWQDVDNAEKVYRIIGNEHYFVESERGFLSRYFNFARILVRGAAERAKPDSERLSEYTEAALPEIEQSLFSTVPIHPEFEQVKLSWSLDKMREWLGVDDPVVKKVLGKESPDIVATRLIRSTQLGDIATRRMLWNKPQEVYASNDPFIRLALSVDKEARTVRRRVENEVEGVEQRAGQTIAEARFAMTGTNIYPDATFTLRLSYGEVQGWQEAGQEVAPFTFISGAFDRHTGAAPFALPKSWLDARSRLKGATPFNFVTTNDMIGGNSGSAIINRRGELVGLAFDGNIHSLGGAFGFDENVNRAIALHPAALLQALREIYKADELLRELDAK